MIKTENKGRNANVLLLDVSKLDAASYELFRGKASPARLKKADRYIKEEDGKICIMAEALLRYAYIKEKGEGKTPEIIYPKHEKPYAENDADFRFSISHTGSVIALGYGEDEIGVDVEQINLLLDRRAVADAVFTPEEKTYVFSSTQGEKERFTRIWTAKESYLKYLGKGFGKNPLTFAVDAESGKIHELKYNAPEELTLTEKRISEEYYITVCSGAENVNITNVTMNDLRKALLS